MVFALGDPEVLRWETKRPESLIPEAQGNNNNIYVIRAKRDGWIHLGPRNAVGFVPSQHPDSLAP
jgi:hypothetical protein